MDRFIEDMKLRSIGLIFYLKSNMDRFIVGLVYDLERYRKHLKSNMDRFIDFVTCIILMSLLTFKIQYG